MYWNSLNQKAEVVIVFMNMPATYQLSKGWC